MLTERTHNNMSNFFEDDGSVLAHIMLGIQNNGQSPKRHTEYCKNDGVITDKRVYVCPKCSRGWEFMLTSTGSQRTKTHVLYTSNVVKYGKQRKVCKSCLDRVCIKESKKPPYSGD